MELLIPYRKRPNDIARACGIVRAVMLGNSCKSVGEVLGVSAVCVRVIALRMCHTYMKKEYLDEHGDLRKIRKNHKNRIIAHMEELMAKEVPHE